MRSRLLRLLLTVVVVALGLEALLWLTPLPDPHDQLRRTTGHRFHLYLPGWNVWTSWFGEEPPFVTRFATGPLIGISTTNVTLEVNRFGFLYDEARGQRQSQQEIRVGVVGGSTVECSSLVAGRRWPDVLERVIAERKPGWAVTVLNLGVSGTDTRTYLATVAQHAVKLELDYLVFLLGANEMFRANSSEHPLDRPDVFREQPQPGWKTVLFRFQLFRRIRVLFNRLRGTDYHVTEPGGEPYFAARIGEIQDLPVLSAGSVDVSESALADYESNVVSLAALARAHETTPLFLTQPALWKEAMSDREEAVDWLIGTVVRDGQRYRVTPAAQAQALEKLNKRLLETCARRALICVDLESRIPRTLEYFYDSVHFNEAGAERVAASVAESLLTAPH